MTASHQLLRRYVEAHAEDAFREIVTRHIDVVYSAALRMVNGDSHLAADVARNVFADLARKAASLPHDVVLVGLRFARLNAAPGARDVTHARKGAGSRQA